MDGENCTARTVGRALNNWFSCEAIIWLVHKIEGLLVTNCGKVAYQFVKKFIHLRNSTHCHSASKDERVTAVIDLQRTYLKVCEFGSCKWQITKEKLHELSWWKKEGATLMLPIWQAQAIDEQHVRLNSSLSVNVRWHCLTCKYPFGSPFFHRETPPITRFTFVWHILPLISS